MEGYINKKTENGLCTITFYHPAHNSLTTHLFSELKSAIEEAGNSDIVKIILLKSDGEKSYSAGASFTELSKLESESEAIVFFSALAKVINAMRTCSKIILTRVHGKAIGGGVGLAAASDYAIANVYASVRLSELFMGLGPFVIGPAVERKIGIAAFGHMTLNPEEWQTAQWAKNKGLYAEAFDNTEQMDAYIAHYISKLLTYSSDALSEIKNMLWEGTSHWDIKLMERAAISGRLVFKKDAQEAIKKFLK
jgi:methylglutaconyl-CoA hydratase